MDLKEEKGGQVNIFDFKTNKEIEFTSKYNKRLFHPISHLEDCNYNKYALQLSFYAYLSELNAERIGRLALLWINDNDEIITYPVPYMKETIKAIIDHLKNDNV